MPFLWQALLYQSPAKITHRSALCTTKRPFSSLIRKVSDTVTATVSQLTEDVWLAEDKLVTEPRRTIAPQRSLAMNLAERLAAQRGVKQGLVPTSIRVDKSRQYVEFTWPAEAAERAMEAMESATTTSAASPSSSPTPPPPLPVQLTANAPPADVKVMRDETGSADDKDASLPASSSPSVPSAPQLPVRPPFPSLDGQPLRTRALAEFLRAYTPSTDGALGARDIVIYGRRTVTITQIVPMGNYALRFVFSDGHTGGIYSYEYLFYLTGPTTKYGLMRSYLRELKRRRKSRDPPKRAPSRRVAKVAPHS